MRRHIASITSGAALLVGLVAVSPSQGATTVLCPPGCVLAGAVKAGGGMGDPTSIYIEGELDAVVSNLTGDIRNLASVADTYTLIIDGTVATSVGGTISGSATLSAYRFKNSVPTGESFRQSVQVVGTPKQLHLSGPSVQVTLAGVAGAYFGSFVYARVQKEGLTERLAQQCADTAGAVYVPRAPLQPSAVCAALG